MFTAEESQYIANAVNEEVKRNGLANASMALIIVAKLNADLQQQKQKEQAAAAKVDAQSPQNGRENVN